MHYNITNILTVDILISTFNITMYSHNNCFYIRKKVSYREHTKQFSTLQTGSYLFKKILETLNENVQNESIFNSTLLRIISSLSSFRLLINLMS